MSVLEACGLCFWDSVRAAQQTHVLPEVLSAQFYVSLLTERLSKCHQGVKTEVFSFRERQV